MGRNARALLLGDSICQGYAEYVRELFFGIMDIYSVSDNARFTTYLLKYLHTWADNLSLTHNVDVVHFNVGLWDILRIDGDAPLVSISVYEENLQRIIQRIRLVFPEARIIFATTTAVLDGKMSPDFCRRENDVLEYNLRASKIMRQHGIEIDDLHKLTSDVNFSGHLEDGLHFTEEGYRNIAKLVHHAVWKSLTHGKGFGGQKTLKVSSPKLTLSLLEMSRIIVYGFGKCGRYVIERLVSLNNVGASLNIHAIIDANPQKQGVSEDGIQVLSPTEFQEKEKQKNDLLIIALANRKDASLIVDIYRKMGFLVYSVTDLQLLLMHEEGLI